MKKKVLKYFLYDIQSGINNGNDILVKEFKYTNLTLTNSFYYELLDEYVKNNYNSLSTANEISELISTFIVVDNVNNRLIGQFNSDEYLSDVINGIADKTLCIIPKLPVGATFAKYNNYRIVIHSDEDIHRNFPHVHVLSGDGEGTVIDLNKLEFYEGIELTGKDKKKIFKYLKDNQKILLDYYNQIVEHKILDKISIEIIK